MRKYQIGLGLVGKYNSSKLLEKHNRYVEHASVYLETIGEIKNLGEPFWKQVQI